MGRMIRSLWNLIKKMLDHDAFPRAWIFPLLMLRIANDQSFLAYVQHERITLISPISYKQFKHSWRVANNGIHHEHFVLFATHHLDTHIPRCTEYTYNQLGLLTSTTRKFKILRIIYNSPPSISQRLPWPSS